MLSPRDRASILENASPLGRRWLTVFPYLPVLRLKSYHVSAALARRCLLPPLSTECPSCGHPNPSYHHGETCQRHGGPMWVPRHDRIKDMLADGLRSVLGLTVEVEPRVNDGLFPAGLSAASSAPTTRPRKVRNDIRTTGSAVSGLPPTDYDLVIPSLDTVHSSHAWTKPPTMDEPAADTQHRLQEWGASHAKRKVNNLNLLPNTTLAGFLPLVLSSGGWAEPGTQRLLHQLSRLMSPGAYSFMMNRISLALVQHSSQASTY
jgi:hypothetical protein